jgi:hypothetical protein
MVKCEYADKYKGVYPPTCNGGKPCDTCKEIYSKAQNYERSLRDAMASALGVEW